MADPRTGTGNIHPAVPESKEGSETDRKEPHDGDRTKEELLAPKIGTI